MGATPIFAALIGLALGTEVLPGASGSAPALSLAGVALVALGTGARS